MRRQQRNPKINYTKILTEKLADDGHGRVLLCFVGRSMALKTHKLKQKAIAVMPSDRARSKLK